MRVHYDGHHHYETSGLLVAHSDPKLEAEASGWLKKFLQPDQSLSQAASLCLTAWQALTDEKPLAGTEPNKELLRAIAGRTVEAALLDRHSRGTVNYRPLDLAALPA